MVNVGLKRGLLILASIAVNIELSHLKRRMAVGEGTVFFGKRIPGGDGRFQ
jgi:hypothetical protein